MAAGLQSGDHGLAEAGLRRLGLVPFVIVDEVGYIPFEPEAANLKGRGMTVEAERH
jgi:hypothetical protein